MRRTCVLVADPHAIFRSGVSALLAGNRDFTVIEAANLDDVERAALSKAPEVALIDSSLPPAGGIAAAIRLVEQCSTHTILWSFDPDHDEVIAALRAGASGFLHKHISPVGLLRALRGAARGEAALSRDLATLVVEALHGLEEHERTRERASVLSAREREVLELVTRGARNKQIAAALFISEFTVKRHIQNILQKLDVPSRRAAAALYAAAVRPREEAEPRKTA